MGEITRYPGVSPVTTGTAETVVASFNGPSLDGPGGVNNLPTVNVSGVLVRVRAKVIVQTAGTAAAGFTIRVRKNTVGGANLTPNVAAAGTSSPSNGGAQPVTGQILECDFWDSVPAFPTTYVVTVLGWSVAGTVGVSGEVELVN